MLCICVLVDKVADDVLMVVTVLLLFCLIISVKYELIYKSRNENAKYDTLEISKTSVLNNPCNKLVNILFVLEPSKNDDESIFFNILILLILI
jgi:hypothetical protein